MSSTLSTLPPSPGPSAALAASCRSFQSVKDIFLPPGTSTQEEDSWMQQGCRAPLGFVQLRDQPDFPLSGLPSPGGLGPEGGRAHSAWNCHPSPPRSAWQLRAPPGLSARIYFLPGQRHFISQEAGWGSSTFSLLSVSALSLGCPPPQGLPAHPPAPDIGTGCPGPLRLGPLQARLGPSPNQPSQVPAFPSR